MPPTEVNSEKDQVDSSKEPTPIADELTRENQQVDENDEVEDDDDLDDVPEAPEKARAVKADVKRALERTTYDGPGDDDPGPSDFVSYSEPDVEVEAEK